MFALRTEVGASSNDAKIAYTSPEVFGLQIALSFTPTEAKELPFLNAGPHLPGRQADIWEGAVRYETDLGPASLSAYGAFAEGRAEHKLPGQEGVSDLGAGIKADYPVSDDITLSLGGSWRQSNAHAFDVNQSFVTGTTRAGYVSSAVSYKDWMAGLEYGNGVADAVPGSPRLGQNGMQASLGYTVSSSASISTGWQHLTYARASGAFFNGLPQMKLDAFYLHVNLKTSEQ
jgi:predicted porin